MAFRLMDGSTGRAGAGLDAFLNDIAAAVPAHRILTDAFSRVVHGADASFYRLIPQAVVIVETEAEVASVCRSASRHRIAITFRAAGTSLSGQGVTDAVLVKLGHDGWREFEATEGGTCVRLGPGLTGGQANACLSRFGRRIGPDPASLNAAMIGGIAANNSSGMCCGTSQNAYRTLLSMRLVLADGTVLDTARKESRADFERTHGALLRELARIAEEAKADAALSALVSRKYAIKNTTGYALNALIDFEDPFNILQHLIIGSEGTLGFVAQIVLRTVPDPKCKAAALILFTDMETACRATIALAGAPVSAVELMDDASLRSVVGKPGIPSHLSELAPSASALLIDLRAETLTTLAADQARVEQVLAGFEMLSAVSFETDPRRYAALWNVRKGLLPAVGATRAPGTTVIVEDVAVPRARLAQAAQGLRNIFASHGYDDAIIFGHALDGNLHFVFPQSFNTDADVARYDRLTRDVVRLITGDLDGSLKAEHGTGRAMAPFVEIEWGRKAYALMRRIKAAFDPLGVLNPGVILSEDPELHLRNLKPLPITDPMIDGCIECGFCEAVCPSRALTLTPRQRIVAVRERERRGGRLPPEIAEQFSYQAVATCAGDGLCALACPVGIDTGAMMRQERAQGRGDKAQRLARLAERHMPHLIGAASAMLWLAQLGQRTMGTGAMRYAINGASSLSGGAIPRWNDLMPVPAARPPRSKAASESPPDSAERPNGMVVLFTSCVNCVVGDDGAPEPLAECLTSIFARAGFGVIAVRASDAGCCGMPFSSKGFPDVAARGQSRTIEVLYRASEGGRWPIIADLSSCAGFLSSQDEHRIAIMEVGRALHDLALPHLTVRRKQSRVMLHVTCSAWRMGDAEILASLAAHCADEVIQPADIACCGFAGDKGFTTPELNANALRHLRSQVPEGCVEGYSTSRSCELGLTLHSGIPYRSIAYLVDWATKMQPS